MLQDVDVVIACEDGMSAKCAYEHGYRPWTQMEADDGARVPPARVASYLSLCAKATTQCTEKGNHIMVIDDYGLNRPYPPELLNDYFTYESMYIYEDGESRPAVHREQYCKMRAPDTSLRCTRLWDQLPTSHCVVRGAAMYTVRALTSRQTAIAEYDQIEIQPQSIHVTDEGRWIVTGLVHNQYAPRIGIYALSLPGVTPLGEGAPMLKVPVPEPIVPEENTKTTTLDQGMYSIWWIPQFSPTPPQLEEIRHRFEAATGRPVVEENHPTPHTPSLFIQIPPNLTLTVSTDLTHGSEYPHLGAAVIKRLRD